MGHQIHAEFRRARQNYAKLIERTKLTHWNEFIENASDVTIWSIHNYMARTPMDRGRTKVPTLHEMDPTGCRIDIHSNQQKGRVLQNYFCPSSTPMETARTQCVYPKPAFKFQLITNEQIEGAIAALSLMKAPGPNGIGNVIFKQCQSLLTLHLGPIFRATFNMHHYPQVWKESKTVILQKPNKPDYTTPKAYRPIALLDTMSKILSSCVARMLTNESEHHELLEKHQFGARPG